MAFVSKRELLSTGSETDEKGNTTYKRLFHIFVNDTSDGPDVARANLGIGIGNAYVFGSGGNIYAVCDGISVNKVLPLRFDVEVRYTTDREQQENPVDFEPIYAMDSREVTVIVDFTVDSPPVPILNAAKDPFSSPAVTETYDVSVYTVQMNLPDTVTLATLAAYNGKLNSSAWGRFAAKTLRCKVSAQQVKMIKDNKPIRYKATTWRFTEALEGTTWVKRVLNAGFRHFDPDDDGKKKNIKDEDDNDISSPWCLAVSGVAIDKDAPELANYLSFNTLYTANFSSIPFGAPN
jgi:hypothetical protein